MAGECHKSIVYPNIGSGVMNHCLHLGLNTTDKCHECMVYMWHQLSNMANEC